MAERAAKKARAAALSFEGDENVNLPMTPIPANFEGYPMIVQVSGNARMQMGDNVYVTRNYQDGITTASDATMPAFRIGESRRRPYVEEEHEVSDPHTLVKLLESLKFPQMFARQRNVRPALLHTCGWLFKHREYQYWIDDMRLKEHHGFLWIKGKPGCGKSTLMKIALDKAGEHLPQYLRVSHFFNARSPAILEKSVLGLYRSVVHQIVSKLGSVQEQFLHAFKTKVSLHYAVEDWTESELQAFLIDIVRQPTHLSTPLKLSIFIDALDEGDNDDIRHMISFLEQLTLCAIESEIQHSVRICLSSRHYPHITIKRGLSLIMDGQFEHKMDIERYVNNTLNIEDVSASEALSICILEKAHDIFLWVVLVVASLNKMHDEGYTFQQLVSYVQLLSNELFGLFKNILSVEPATAYSTVSLFQWVLLANRAMTPIEVYAAVHDQSGSPGSFQCGDIPPGVVRKFLLRRSRGLVEIAATDGGEVVQFIHETVRDFLLDPRGLSCLDSSLESNPVGYSHEVLKERCIQETSVIQLDFRENKSPTIYQKLSAPASLWHTYPLLQYAIKYLFEHCNKAQVAGIDQRHFLASVNQGDSVLYQKWRYLYGLIPYGQLDQHEASIPLLYMLITHIYGRLQDIIYTMIDMGVDVNASGGRYGNPLQAAVSIRNAEIARRLIAAGADINASGGVHENVLMATISSFDEELFQLVKNCTAPTSSKLLQRRFNECVERNLYNRIALLLDRGADVNGTFDGETTTSPIYGPPLTIAIRNKNLKMLRLLLKSGADINTSGGQRDSPLMAAILTGSIDIMDALITEGADIDAVSMFKFSRPLILAIATQDESVALMLISRGVNVNVQCKPTPADDWCDALQFSLIRKQIQVAHALIRNGADVNCVSGPYHTPLQAAAAGGHTDTVKLLLEYGADIHALGGEYGCALQAAIDENHHDIAKILTDLGAERARPPSSPETDEEERKSDDEQLEEREQADHENN